MSKENMTVYEQVRQVPVEAQKKITGGRLNGMTDINPMWRIQKLTEIFGMCGVGWYPEIVSERLEQGADGEVTAHTNINLYVKTGDGWSKPIPGVGGAKFIADERGGLYTDDEAFKKAYTDAMSVACKALGIGADVYWAKGGETKYTPAQPAQEPVREEKPLTLDEASQFTTKSGKKYYELSEEQLQYIIDKSSNARCRAAAQLVLDDMQAAFDELPPLDEANLPF